MKGAEYQCVSMRVDVSLGQQQVSESLIFADDRLLSFKPYDTGVFGQDIEINILWPGQRPLLASPEQQPARCPDPGEVKSLFHISIKTYDKHRFEISIELNLELTNIGLHLNGGC